MWVITKREFKNYLKNPILWAGLVVIVIFIGQQLYPYFTIHYFLREEEIPDLSIVEVLEKYGDVDVMYGYIPSTKEQQMSGVYQAIQQTFRDEFGYSEKGAEDIIEELKQKEFSLSELDAYMADKYSFYNVSYLGDMVSMYKGTMGEVNAYIKEKFNKHSYSYYFSRKFADFGGLFMGVFAMVLLAFLYVRDSQKDIYELLHTKPISAKSYIFGKVMGGFLAMLFVLGILNVIFGAICEIAGRRAGFPVKFWNILGASLLYIVPNLLMITCVYTMVSMVFRNPFPALPILFCYLVYSNMGSRGPDGRYGYYGRPLAIMVRFPGKFLDTAPPPMVLWNQLFLMVASALIICIAIWIWRKRRI